MSSACVVLSSVSRSPSRADHTLSLKTSRIRALIAFACALSTIVSGFVSRKITTTSSGFASSHVLTSTKAVRSGTRVSMHDSFAGFHLPRWTPCRRAAASTAATCCGESGTGEWQTKKSFGFGQGSSK